MLRFLTLLLVVVATLAWDPSLKIAEKIAIPHHVRHSYDYPEINIRDIQRQVNQNVRQGFSQLSGPSNQGFRQSVPVQQPNRGFQSSQPFDSNRGFSAPQRPAFEPNRGFQSSPFEQSRGGFRGAPAGQTRFFNFNQNPRPEFGSSGRSGSFFNRRS